MYAPIWRAPIWRAMIPAGDEGSKAAGAGRWWWLGGAFRAHALLVCLTEAYSHSCQYSKYVISM